MSKSENPQGYGGGGNYGGYYYGEGYGDYGSGAAAPQRSIKEYLMILRERVWWLVISVFVVFLGVALFTLNQPKIYTSVAKIEILRDKARPFLYEEIRDTTIRSADDFNTQVEVMESLSIIELVNERLTGSVRQRFLAPYERGLDAALREPPSIPQILLNNRRIAPARMSLIVNVVFEHHDPEIAALVANYFAEEYIDFNRRKEMEESMGAVEDLKNQAEQQMNRLRDIELRIAAFKDRHNTLAVEQDTNINNQEIIALRARLNQDKQMLDQAQTTYEQVLEAQEAGLPLWELDVIAMDPRVAEMVHAYSQTQIEIAMLGERFRAKHPTMIAARQVETETRSQLDRAIRATVSRLSNTYEAAESNFLTSERRLAQKEQEIFELERIRPEFNTLLRDREITHELYQHAASRLQQASATVRGSQKARIIDEATPSSLPSRPRVALNLAIGFAGGIFVGLGLVFALALLDDKVKTAFDIESTMGMNLIGIIPRISHTSAENKARVVADQQDRHTVEAFRAIYSTLKLNEESKNAKVILTTSTVPSEGKSFVSTNMALTFASHGERTIIVDGDLRMPNIAKSLKLKNQKGAIPVLKGEASLDDSIVKDLVPNLDVMPTGGRTKQPTQLLGNEAFEKLIYELRNRYDRVIIDSPPLAPVSDALSIIPFVDGVIYVVRFNTVKRKTGLLNIKRIRESNIPIFGAVLNNINTHIVGYYYSHYYDRSYDSYYRADLSSTENTDPVDARTEDIDQAKV